MANDRYSGNSNRRMDYDGHRNPDYGPDYGSSYGSYSSARDYRATGNMSGLENRDEGRSSRQSSGGRDYRMDPYEGGRDEGREYHGSYASDGRRFEDIGRYRDMDNDNRVRGRDDSRQDLRKGRSDNRPDGRGFIDRAGDEVRSWFGDDDAERRRERDARYDERQASGRSDRDHDRDYVHWRSGQIAAFDRDYDEYREENRDKFHREFGTWREQRQGQRNSLTRIKEHMEVVGSDGKHIGTVDKVREDRILLTKNDKDADGRHHSFPSSWIIDVGDKVKVSRSAEDAKQHWHDEEGKQAMFGDNQREDRGQDQGMLNRSFAGS